MQYSPRGSVHSPRDYRALVLQVLLFLVLFYHIGMEPQPYMTITANHHGITALILISGEVGTVLSLIGPLLRLLTI